MCVNSGYIYNRYIREYVWTSCGKCPACLQQKAAGRAQRIRNNNNPDEIALFVTLTYKNDYVPYVRRDELECVHKTQCLPIHRDFDARYVRSRKGDYSQKVKSFVNEKYLDYIEYNKDYLHVSDFSKLLDLNGKKDCIGVLYYPDVQDFLKRLRSHYEERYHKTAQFTYFSCSEYGGSSYRPHFHLLLFVPKKDEIRYRSLIVKSWPFADSYRTARFIEVARDAASYVASYVNSFDGLVGFFKNPQIKQKHSYSKDFGVRKDCFSLLALLDKMRCGNFTYTVAENKADAKTVRVLPIPKYVINRYFPKFKGFSRLSLATLRECLIDPRNFERYLKPEELDYHSDELYRIYVSLKNARDRYCVITGKNYQDYVFDYIHAWTQYSSIRYMMSFYEDGLPVSDFTDFYINNSEYVDGFVRAYTLDHIPRSEFNLNPNSFRRVMKTSANLTELYHKMCKQRKVTNHVMSRSLYLDV